MGRHIRPSILTAGIVELAVIIICTLPVTAVAQAASEPDGGISLQSDLSAIDGNDPLEDANGPTLLLGYRKEDFEQNLISSFMYFVPLVSLTSVETQTSAGNKQQIGIVSYEMKATSKSFKVVCEFEISGKGVHKTAFDPVSMIQEHINEVKEGQPLTNMLDYIRFENEGFVRIEVRGTVTGSGSTIDEVKMNLNARGRKSPVTIGLYDVSPRDGHYKYENRSNEVVARVNSLVFRKTEKTPQMGVKVATLARKNKPGDLFRGIKGAIANLILEPPLVARLGNETVLAFGSTLFKKEPAFTFPRAENIKENRIVGMDLVQK